MKYSIPLWALVSTLALLSFSCGGNGDGDGLTATEPPSAATATPAGAGTQALRAFAGGPGDSTTGEFELSGGSAFFQVTHEGVGEFRAVLFNPLGSQAAVLIGTTLMGGSGSSVSGRIDEMATATVTTPGLHFIKVTADGNWTIDVSQ